MLNSQLREVLICINRILNTIETETNSIDTNIQSVLGSTCPAVDDVGIVVRNIPCGTQDVNVVNEVQYQIRMAYTGSDVEYVGESLPGVAENAIGWRIKKLTYSGGNVVAIDWADDTSQFTKIWNDRATYF